MSELRASDADRDRVAERLRAAAGEGRVSADELEERLERAVADLPGPVRRPARMPPDLGPYVSVSLLLVAIWALTGMGYFWPVWPIMGWGISFLAPGRLGGSCRRRSFNPGSSTVRLPSSQAAAPGSGEPAR